MRADRGEEVDVGARESGRMGPLELGHGDRADLAHREDRPGGLADVDAPPVSFATTLSP